MSTPQLIFSGGSGRSGTTVLAKLLRTHPQVRASRPLEIRCLTDSAGLLDVCLGPGPDAPFGVRALARSRPLLFAEFRRRLRGRWWERTNRLGKVSGLHRGITPEQRETLLRELQRSVGRASREAGRSFLVELARMQGLDAERYWVDTSPPNIAHADRIHRLVPDALFVHMVRDGRDTMASVMNEPWGPAEPEAAATWWSDRMVAAHRALTDVPPDAALTISLESLVVTERGEEYRRLLEFLDLPDRPRMRRYFAEQMPAERVRPGSWRERVADPEQLERAYRAAAQRLEALGVPTHEFEPESEPESEPPTPV